MAQKACSISQAFELKLVRKLSWDRRRGLGGEPGRATHGCRVRGPRSRECRMSPMGSVVLRWGRGLEGALVFD